MLMVLALFTLVTVGTLLVIAGLKFAESGLGWSDVLAKLAAKFTEQPIEGALHLLLLISLILQFVYMMLAQSREQLVLTSDGIEYLSPLPAWLQGLRPSWSMRWEQVRSAVLAKSPLVNTPQTVTLVLDASTGPRKLVPYMWVNPDNYKTVSSLKDLRKAARLGLVSLDSCPLLQYLDSNVPRLSVNREAVGGARPFALESHSHTRVIVFGFFLFGLYALIDGLFINKEVYIEPAFITEYIVVGVTVAFVAGIWQQRGGAPLAESMVLALLLGTAVSAAAYPGALRINALTDEEGLRAYTYVRQPNGSFVAVQPGLPNLNFDDYQEYWARYKAGSEYSFYLRKGGLRFWQLDMAPVYSSMRDYFSSNK